MTQAALVGNPNSGKTTVFNALTGEQQRVGNWPGVTVEQKTGVSSCMGRAIEIVDLPGIYSATAYNDGISQDEQIAVHALSTLTFDCIINVVDACHLERHLYLTSQLLELGKPVILALNMMDIARQRGIAIDVHALAVELGCIVISIEAHKQVGIPALKEALSSSIRLSKPLKLDLTEEVSQALHAMTSHLELKGYAPTDAYYHAHRAIEGGVLADDAHLLTPATGLDVLHVDARYQKIHQIVGVVQKNAHDASNHFTARLDKIILHRWFALPMFFAMMYLMFWFAIHVGGVFQDFFDISTQTLFVDGVSGVLQYMHAPNLLIVLLAYGVGQGINTTLTFIPVIAAMFFFLSLLETSGYMARAAFVVDKIMRLLGLPGKSFIPMIVGFGCNVPAVLATRTLDTQRDKLLTLMMTPFMSCSARLAIYAVFVAAFFPNNGQNVVFSLYLIGIVMAVLTGFLMRHTFLKGAASPFILELPAYHRPSLKRLLKDTSYRLRYFVTRAGKVIIPVCMVLGMLNSFTIEGSVSLGQPHMQSLLSWFGQWLTPLFAPMGITQDNWPATVGLLTGALAKEVVIGTLNSLYSQAGHLNDLHAAPFDFIGGLQAALWSIPQHLSELWATFWHPLTLNAVDSSASHLVYGEMVRRFDGPAGAYAYLLFILLYIPCISTMAAIRQESSQSLMWLSIVWSFVLAWSVAVFFYQATQFMQHPYYSMTWMMSVLCSLLCVFGLLWVYYKHGGRHHVAAAS
jgi:ferrous iron transport protein B